MIRIGAVVTTPNVDASLNANIVLTPLKLVMVNEMKKQQSLWHTHTGKWKPEHRPMWKNERPRLISGGKFAKAGGLEAAYFATRATSPVFVYVMGGTDVRRADMTADFSPRTRKGVLSTRAGSGGLLRVSKKINKKGIEGRMWHFIIPKRRQKIYGKNMQKALTKGTFRAMKGRGQKVFKI